MFTSRRHGVPGNLLPHRVTLGPDAQPLLDLPSEKGWPSEKIWPSEKVWPIRRAVLFWGALSIVGWIAIFGLANYLS
jgi:hypothetical protein